MHHLLVFVFVTSIPFSWLAGSPWVFYLFGLPTLLPGYFVYMGDLYELSLADIHRKLRQMHDRMDAVAKHVRNVIRRRGDWEQAIMEVLPTLEDKALRLIVLEVLRAEGYQLVRKPKCYRDKEQTILLRKDGREAVLKLNPQAHADADSTEMVDFVRTLCDKEVDDGISVAMGRVTDRAHVMAERNHIRLLDSSNLAKAIVRNRKRIQLRHDARNRTHSETAHPEAPVLWN